MSKPVCLAIIAAYIVLMACIIWGMFAYRQSMLVSLDTVEAREAWRQWREESARQSVSGPVKRHPVASSLPPAEILLRDYFPSLMAGALFFPSFFYFLFVWILRGAARTSLNRGGDGDAAIAIQTGQTFAAKIRRNRGSKP